MREKKKKEKTLVVEGKGGEYCRFTCVVEGGY